MGTLFEDIRDGIRDGIELFVDKTEEYSKIGKIKVEMLSVKRNIEKAFSELGGRTYELLSGEKRKAVASDTEIKRLVDELKGLEESLDVKKNEIKSIKEEKEKERKVREEARKKEDESKDESGIEDAKIVDEKKTKK